MGVYPFDLGESQSDQQSDTGTILVRSNLESLGAVRPFTRPGYGGDGWKNLVEEAFGSIFTSTPTRWMEA
jgi:hypothetical protein